MATFITALMHNRNNGQSTFRARVEFFATLRLNGVKFTTETPCEGFWYDGEELYSGITTLVTMHGDETAMRAVVGQYGVNAGQIEMLFVERVEGFKLGTAQGRKGAERLAREHGGATLLPDNIAISFNYSGLRAGVDYSDRNTVRK